MTKPKNTNEWLKYSNWVPLIIFIISSIIGITAFWTSFTTQLALTNQKLDFISQQLTTNGALATNNSLAIQALDKRISVLENEVVTLQAK